MIRVGLALVCALCAAAAAACGPDQRLYTDTLVGFDVFPSTDEALPLNARIAFTRRPGESTDTPPDLAFTHDGVPLTPSVVGRALAQRQEAFVVAPTLDAAAEVTITVDANDGLLREHRWTVADAEDITAPVVGDGPIEIIDSAGFGIGDESGIEVAIRSQAAVDGAPYALRLAGDVDALLRPTPDIESHYVLRVPGVQSRRLCVDAFAVDVAGNETALATQLCGDIAP